MNVLIAVDPSSASEKAVRFAAGLLKGSAASKSSVTLLHAVEPLPDVVLGHSGSGPDDPVATAREQWIAERQAAGEQLLDQHRQTLVGEGISAEAIQVRLIARSAEPQARKIIAALAIIEEMKAHDYDVVCVGRRGESALGGTFIGSVAEKVLRSAEGRTVCVVD